MESNDLNRRVRYALMLDDADVVRMLALAGYTAYAGLDDVKGWRLKELDADYRLCPPSALHAMLDGLIIDRRGVRQEASVPVAKASTQKAGASGIDLPEKGATPAGSGTADRPLDNNDVLKQLRIALSLKADEVHALIAAGGGTLGKSEVNALFRKPSARNYRRCGGQVLRWFLAGLANERNGR